MNQAWSSLNRPRLAPSVPSRRVEPWPGFSTVSASSCRTTSGPIRPNPVSLDTPHRIVPKQAAPSFYHVSLTTSRPVKPGRVKPRLPNLIASDHIQPSQFEPRQPSRIESRSILSYRASPRLPCPVLSDHGLSCPTQPHQPRPAEPHRTEPKPIEPKLALSAMPCPVRPNRVSPNLD